MSQLFDLKQLIGKHPDDAVKEITGLSPSMIFRIVNEGDMMTCDYRPERVTIHVANHKVTEATMG